MKNNTAIVIVTLLRCVVAISAFYFAFLLASHKLDGWGWFIVIGMFASAFTVTLSSDKENE